VDEMQIRETPHKRHHKFIEFYDVRGAEAALRALNRSDIAGKRIKLEPSLVEHVESKFLVTFLNCFFLISKFSFIESIRRPYVHRKYTTGNT
jgi:RNA recognition motif-containing protein